MSTTPRKLIAAAGLAAAISAGSVVPAQAIPTNPTPAHCERVDRITDQVERRIDRFEAQIERLETRAEARPERARGIERRIERLTARIDRIEYRLAAVVEACTPEVPANEPGENTPDNDSADNGGGNGNVPVNGETEL